MTRKVISALAGDSVQHVAAILAEHDISALPVVDAAGKLLGMISEGDLLMPFSTKNQARRAWWLDMLAEGERLAPEFVAYVSMDQHVASDLMTRNVVSAQETASIPEIANLLVEHHVKRVPILRDGTVVGIVSRADIVRHLSRDLDGAGEEHS